MTLERSNAKPYRVVCILMAGIFGLFYLTMALAMGVDRLASLPVMGVFVGVLALCLFALWELDKRIQPLSQRLRLALYLMGGVAVLALQVGLMLSVYGEYGWDVYSSMELGMNLVDVGEGIEVASRYPNNLALYVLYGNLVWWLLDLKVYDYMLPLVLLNLVIVDTAVLLGANLARRSLGRRGMRLYLLIALPLILLNLWNSVPYTDTLTIVYPPLILYLWDKARTAPFPKALGLWALMGLAACIGYLFKPTALIAFIAVAILSFFFFAKAAKPISSSWPVWFWPWPSFGEAPKGSICTAIPSPPIT
ncbi:MAG: hypothetical protein IJ461_10135 [Clostridia bacterium]|nr:hypothetical protein [Clostridia bacterium]